MKWVLLMAQRSPLRLPGTHLPDDCVQHRPSRIIDVAEKELVVERPPIGVFNAQSNIKLPSPVNHGHRLDRLAIIELFVKAVLLLRLNLRESTIDGEGKGKS
jgi:hypothetical protein